MGGYSGPELQRQISNVLLVLSDDGKRWLRKTGMINSRCDFAVASHGNRATKFFLMINKNVFILHALNILLTLISLLTLAKQALHQTPVRSRQWRDHKEHVKWRYFLLVRKISITYCVKIYPIVSMRSNMSSFWTSSACSGFFYIITSRCSAACLCQKGAILTLNHMGTH